MGSENKRYPCPVCGALTFDKPGNFETCEVCGWEDDDLCRDEPDRWRSTGKYTLNEARKVWAAGKAIDPDWPHP